MVIALVETMQGIQNLDEILAVEQIDVVAIGSGDLSMSMGLPGQRNHPDVIRIVDDANARIAAAGKVITAIVGNAAEARQAALAGARLLAVPDDVLFGGAARNFLNDAKQWVSAQP